MLKDDVILYSKLTGNDGLRTSIGIIGAYLDGYEKGKADAEPRWIPVEQGLPKIGEYVLCKTTRQYFGKYHVCKFVDKDKWVDKPHFDWDHNGFPYVIAWTRFEPYKEGEKNG